MKLLSKFCFLLQFISINACNSQTQPPKVIKLYPIDSLTNIVIESLRSKRVVMLGDGTTDTVILTEWS